MVNSSKLVLFLSTSVILPSFYIFFILPPVYFDSFATWQIDYLAEIQDLITGRWEPRSFYLWEEAYPIYWRGIVSGNPDKRTQAEQLFFERMTAEYGERILKYLDLSDEGVGVIRGHFYLDAFPIHLKSKDTRFFLNLGSDLVYNRAFSGNTNFVEIFFQFFKLFLVWFGLILVSLSILKKKSLLLSFSKLYVLLRSYIFLNLPFVSSLEAVVLFIYLFFSLYFLEVHFFFIFLGGLSTDSFIYQFNFLLSSFLFIFFFKFTRGSVKQGLLVFAVPYHLVSFIFLERGTGSKLGNFVSPSLASNRSSGILKLKRLFGFDFVISSKFILRIFISIFFFFSTFLVWFLRYCIQFIRLMVLFIIHGIFEQLVVSSDTHYISFMGLNFLIFKFFFFFFVYFCSFLYLIVYLNLMFTLQFFIFYFFSEVFQSNLVFDLSAIVVNRVNFLK